MIRPTDFVSVGRIERFRIDRSGEFEARQPVLSSSNRNDGSQPPPQLDNTLDIGHVMPLKQVSFDENLFVNRTWI